jgi:prepilin-type N-terminal cleavage/methylation domain-containing protein
MRGKSQIRTREAGYSLIEMMVVVLILSVVTGGIFLQLDTRNCAPTASRSNWIIFRKRGISSISFFATSTRSAIRIRGWWIPQAFPGPRHWLLR